MSDMITAEEAGKLLDDASAGPWLWRWKSGSLHMKGQPPYEYGSTVLSPIGVDCDIDIEESDAALIAAAPDLARTVIALHAQLADAKAAQAMALQEAADACRYLHVIKTEDRHGPWNSAVLQCCELIRALADTDGLALVQALRAERDALETARELLGGFWAEAAADRDRLAAANAALEAQVARLVGALEALRHAVCGETGFASCVRADSGKAYPWPALDEAEALVNAALAEVQADARREGGA